MNEASGTAILPYDAVGTAPDPRATLLEFFEDTSRGGTGGGLEPDDLATSAAPGPTQTDAPDDRTRR